MTRRLSVTVERFPLAREFRIARGAKTEAVVVTCVLDEEGATGRGECVPYARYGESPDSVVAQIEAVRANLESEADRSAIQGAMPPGAARNAVDCALWDLEAKRGSPAPELADLRGAHALETAYTIGLDEPQAMAEAARASGFDLLKIKLGTADDRPRMEAIRRAVPQARLILDANEGWSEENIRQHLAAASRIRAALVEQPLPDGADAILAAVPHPVPVCADESAHTSEGLEALADRYDVVNVKLDKTGGLTEALKMAERARELGFGIMVGCMVGSSLAMAPALVVARRADYVDLDGPLLLASDREHGLRYEGALISPPHSQLWG